MSGFSDLAATAAAAVRAHLTDAALWRAGGTGDGVAVRVTFEEPDVEIRFGESRGVAPTSVLGVFKSDVAAPAKGDTCEITEGPSLGRAFRVTARPKLDADGDQWLCEAVEVQP